VRLCRGPRSFHNAGRAGPRADIAFVSIKQRWSSTSRSATPTKSECFSISCQTWAAVNTKYRSPFLTNVPEPGSSRRSPSGVSFNPNRRTLHPGRSFVCGGWCHISHSGTLDAVSPGRPSHCLRLSGGAIYFTGRQIRAMRRIPNDIKHIVRISPARRPRLSA
jgi:hypothetical protein